MSPSLDKQLCEKYPNIFLTQELGTSFGFECGDGWYKVIDMLCMAASNTYSTGLRIDKEDAAKYGIESPDDEAGERYYFTVESPQIVASQVKEKFGTLRFYYTGGDEYIRGLVSMAESMSAVTCEQCGNPGTTGGQGWIKTLCETHRNKNG